MSDFSNFAAAVLRGIGAPVTRQNIAGFIGWSQAEGPLGSDNWRGHNPLNTTLNAPGARSRNSVGVKAYPDEQTGIRATIQTLKNGHYGGILQAFHANNPHALAGAIGASPWGTSGSLAAQTIAQALRQPWSVPAGGGPVVSIPGGKPGRSVASGTDTIGGGTNYQALAEGILAKEAARPISSGLHGNPLQDYASALSSGFYNTPVIKVPGGSVPAPAGRGPQRGSNLSPNAASGLPSGLAHFDGKPVAAWIAPALTYARAHGWRGSVSSGYRSDAEQTAIYKSGVRPAALPRSMGGQGSNHEGTRFPLGAVDVTEAAQLSSILARSPYAKLLVWAGSKDPVHFSHPHGGGY